VALTKIIALPSGILGASTSCCTPNIIKASPPKRPMTAPKHLSQVTFSLIKSADSTNTKMGVMVTITELLIGVVKLKPLKKNNILRAIPSTAHNSSLGQCSFLIFSFFDKKNSLSKIGYPHLILLSK